MKYLICVACFVVFSLGYCCAQRVIRGHIYGGLNQTSPVDSMQVRTSSGNITYTDIHGLYAIDAKPTNDTIFISFKGREIIHYPISFITTPDKFDVYLQNPGFYDPSYADELPEVRVMTRNYHKDSLANRQMYANVFDYTKPKFNPFSPVTSVYNLFDKKNIKRQERYRQFAKDNEQSGYVDSRFTRSYVSKIANIKDDDELSDFMKEYRPTFQDLVNMNELELGQYIIDSYKEYKKLKDTK